MYKYINKYICLHFVLKNCIHCMANWNRKLMFAPKTYRSH